MIPITGNTCEDAWQNAVSHLLENSGESVNLIVHVDDPTHFDPAWLTMHDPHRVHTKHDKIRDVINTVFPMNLYRRNPARNALYQKYEAIYERAKCIGQHPARNKKVWGTYFGRLINVDRNFGIQLGGQLEKTISALSSWNHRYTAAFVFHLSSPHIDNPKPMGSPCWQFGEILWNSDNTLDLVVVYRNHDYFNKALGNIIALGQLLHFICYQSNKQPGILVCHSVHAYLPVSKTATRQLALIA